MRTHHGQGVREEVLAGEERAPALSSLAGLDLGRASRQKQSNTGLQPQATAKTEFRIQQWSQQV